MFEVFYYVIHYPAHIPCVQFFFFFGLNILCVEKRNRSFLPFNASIGRFGLVFRSVIIYLCSYSIVHFKVFLTCRYFVGFELTHTYGKWNSNGISQKWYPSLCPSAHWLPFYFLLLITIFIEFTNMCLISMSEVVFIYPNCAYLFYFYLEKKNIK